MKFVSQNINKFFYKIIFLYIMIYIIVIYSLFRIKKDVVYISKQKK